MGSVSKLLGREIDGGKIVLVSVSSKQYREATGDLIEFSRKFKKTCYITLNDPYESIKAKAGSAMVFIDCVTSSIKSPKTEEGVIFVSSPRALTEISIAIKRAIETFKMDFVIFDSLSALLVYEKSLSAMKFVHSLILSLRNAKTGTVLIILKEDVSEEAMKDLSMFVDKVVELG